ncbi:hypothetical protein D5086_020361 [Populus alba]|uniref:Uncharacterized protein n=1 Tax=Populus alba TaxID=43335 RepID=A0ACC4BL74_POPAL
MATAPFPPVIQQSPAQHSSYHNTTYASNPLSCLPKCTLLKELKQIQAFSIKTHLQNDLQILTKLINSCTQNPTTASMDYAHQLFETIPQPDIVLFNSMFRGYSRSNAPLKAISLFIKALNCNLLPDDYTFPSLLKACVVAKAFQQGKQLHCLAIKLGLNENPYVCPTLINMYAGCNDVDGAQRVFDEILEPCVVSYNAIITGYARSSRPNEALSHGNLELAKQVMNQILELDDSHGGDYVILSNLCARAGKWEDVDTLRKLMIHKGAVKIPGCSSIEVDNVVHEFFSGDGVHYVSTALHRALDELMEANSSTLIKLLVLLCLSVLSVSQDFDFFYFVQQWPGSYCDTMTSCCTQQLENLRLISAFMDFGPITMTGHTQKTVADLRSGMQKSWPTLACSSGTGVAFWTHEWEKHGTCSESTLDQHGYFQAALDLKKQVNLLQALTNAGINPDGGSYSLSSIKSAIQEAVGFTPWIECNTDTSRNSQLYQIYLCVDTSGKNLIDCPVFPKGKCDSEIEFPSF